MSDQNKPTEKRQLGSLFSEVNKSLIHPKDPPSITAALTERTGRLTRVTMSHSTSATSSISLEKKSTEPQNIEDVAISEDQINDIIQYSSASLELLLRLYSTKPTPEAAIFLAKKELSQSQLLMLWSTGKQCIVSDEFWNIAAKKINFNTLSQKEIVVLCSEAKSDHVGTLAIEASTLDLDARMDILIQSHFSHALIKILLNKNIIDIIDLIESIKMKNPDNWGDMFPKELFIYLQGERTADILADAWHNTIITIGMTLKNNLFWKEIQKEIQKEA